MQYNEECGGIISLQLKNKPNLCCVYEVFVFEDFLSFHAVLALRPRFVLKFRDKSIFKQLLRALSKNSKLKNTLILENFLWYLLLLLLYIISPTHKLMDG